MKHKCTNQNLAHKYKSNSKVTTYKNGKDSAIRPLQNRRNAKIKNYILMKIVNRGMEQPFKSRIYNVHRVILLQKVFNNVLHATRLATIEIKKKA